MGGRLVPRICVVSLNPAIDAEWRVPFVVPGEKNELISERRWPGGKGINVARWLSWLGARPHLILPLGGATGAELAAGLKAERLAYTGVPIAQSTRVNVVVTPDVGTQLRFNPSWPVLSSAEVRALLAEIEMAWRHADAVVLSGSLVRGAPVDTYAGLVRRARRAGLPVFLDCDGEAFRLAAREGPSMVKPNEPELATWADGPVDEEKAFRAAARKLARATGEWVLASRGSQGAVLVNGSAEWETSAPAMKVAKVRNTVGAGDAMLAGAVMGSAGAGAPRSWLSLGLRTAAAAVRSAPGTLPRPFKHSVLGT